jgi:hypothetical protein
MKPTVSDRRNPTDLRLLMLVHRGPRLLRYAALEACQADVSQTRSSSLPTRVKDVVTPFVHATLPLAGGLMGVLGVAVHVAMFTMFYAAEHLTLCRAVAFQPLCPGQPLD